MATRKGPRDEEVSLADGADQTAAHWRRCVCDGASEAAGWPAAHNKPRWAEPTGVYYAPLPRALGRARHYGLAVGAADAAPDQTTAGCLVVHRLHLDFLFLDLLRNQVLTLDL